MGRNYLWFKGSIERGTIVSESVGGLVIAREVSESEIVAICETHNRVVRDLLNQKE